MPYPHIDRLSYMLDYSVSLADEITRWMDSVANSLTDVANCITHARNSLNMTGKTGDAIEVNLDSLSKAILQHTDNIGILTSARRTVAEDARTAVSHANEVKNESSSIGFSHGGLTIENDTDSGQSSPASGSTSDSSTGRTPLRPRRCRRWTRRRPSTSRSCRRPRTPGSSNSRRSTRLTTATVAAGAAGDTMPTPASRNRRVRLQGRWFPPRSPLSIRPQSGSAAPTSWARSAPPAPATRSATIRPAERV